MSSAWISAFVALWVVVIFLAVTLLGWLRRTSLVLEQAEARLAAAPLGMTFGGAPPGTQIPPFEVADEHGAPVSSAELLRTPSVVLFMSSGCEACHHVASELDGLDGRVGGIPLHLLIEDSEAARRFPFPPRAPVLFQAEQAASKAFQNVTTPQAFGVDASGRVIDVVIPGSRDDLLRLASRAEGGETAARDASTQIYESVS